MRDWFSVEKLDGQTYVISENRHWEETRCYLLLGAEKAILIDTGLGVSNIKDVVDSITDLPVIVITTHVHWDHIGGHALFENIAVHELEKTWLNGRFPLPLSIVKENLTRKDCDFLQEFDVDEYRVFQGEPQVTMKDGDCFDLGNRVLQVIHTPGHSPGHHTIDIQPSIIEAISDALSELEKDGKLHHGSGLHFYSDFQIAL